MGVKGLKGEDKTITEGIFYAGGKGGENGWELLFFELKKQQEEHQAGYDDWEILSGGDIDYSYVRGVGGEGKVKWIGECLNWGEEGQGDGEEDRVVGEREFDWGEMEIEWEEDNMGNAAPTRETMYRTYAFVFFKSKHKVLFFF